VPPVAEVGEGEQAFPRAIVRFLRPGLGYAYALSGKRAEAVKVIDIMRAQEQKAFASPYGIAVVYAGLRDKNQALAWLRKAYQERDPICSKRRSSQL